MAKSPEAHDIPFIGGVIALLTTFVAAIFDMGRK